MNTEYEKIGEIARNAKTPIRLKELLNLLGLETNGRGMAAKTKAAAKYFADKGEPYVSGLIQRTFINEKGEYPDNS